MKKIKLIATLAASSFLIGCATGPQAQMGTVVGGILGATAGGIIGHQKGRGLQGAAIGGALGAIGGNVYGNGMDQQRYYNQLSQPVYIQSQNYYPCYQREYVFYPY